MGKEMKAVEGKNRARYASIVEKMRDMYQQDKDVHFLLPLKS